MRIYGLDLHHFNGVLRSHITNLNGVLKTCSFRAYFAFFSQVGHWRVYTEAARGFVGLGNRGIVDNSAVWTQIRCGLTK